MPRRSSKIYVNLVTGAAEFPDDRKFRVNSNPLSKHPWIGCTDHDRTTANTLAKALSINMWYEEAR